MWSLILVTAALIPEPVKVPNIRYHTELAAHFLSDENKTVSNAEKPYIRFISWYNLHDYEHLEKYKKSMKFWLNNLHLRRDVEFPRDVPGSNGLLWWFDLRDYGWSKTAWSVVARRDPYFRQPEVPAGPAIFIRKVIGIDQENVDTPHLEAIVRADFLHRDTCETDRSSSYYDLLFSAQRFVEGGEEEYKTTEKRWYGGGYSGQTFYQAGYYDYNVTKTRKVASKFIDFPKNEADLEKLLGVDKVREFIKTSKIDTRYGAVVEGGEKGGSIVARQNRLLERVEGFFGPYYKTYDVKETAGRRDFAETLHKDFDFDAGEILYKLPGGGQGGLLVVANGNRVETADNRFAHDKSDLIYDTRVRTYGSCVVCHESGYIAPKNLISEMMKAGVDIKFKKKQDAQDARAFFLNWEEQLEFDQQRHAKFIARTSGFKPGENSRVFKHLRDKYDAPVDLTLAAKEMGLPEEVFKLVASKSTKARILNLLQGISMPRRTWERDGYREMMLQLDAARGPP